MIEAGTALRREDLVERGRAALLACTMVFLWGNRVGGPLAALMATFLFTTVPPNLRGVR